MATEKSGTLEELTKLATDFVTMQKGMWDHAAWTDFLSNLKSKGFDLSGEMQTHLGELLEAMKRFYAAAGSTEGLETAMRSVMNESVTFIKDHKGVWGHSDWEEYLKATRRNTATLTEGASAYLGGVLESVRVFYSLSPMLPAHKPAPAAKKPEVAAKPELALKKKSAPKPAQPPKPQAKPQVRPAEPKPADKKPVAGTSGKKDDLTAIGGIGPALAKKLNGAGVDSFAKLAALTGKDIEHLEKNIIKFSGRIERDDWVGQAKKLM